MGEKGKGAAMNRCGLWVVGRCGENLGTEKMFGLSDD
jgi:hypothetical protein